MSEPVSALLRRRAQRGTAQALRDLVSGPLADLVEKVEVEHAEHLDWRPEAERLSCRTPLCRSLAALRERLEGKP